MIYNRAIGGLGDFLQMASAAIAAKEILVISHSESGAHFFEELGVKVIGEINFQSLPELASVHNLGINLDRNYYDHTAYGHCIRNKPELIHGYRKDIVIHPFGSKFSQHVDNAYNNAGKSMPTALIRDILSTIRLSTDREIHILGSKEELHNLICEVDVFSYRNVVCYPTSIWEAICHSYEALWFIGVDSFCKTTRCMSANAPYGITLVEDKVDIFRDTHFILPYSNHRFIKFKNLHSEYDRTHIINTIHSYREQWK